MARNSPPGKKREMSSFRSSLYSPKLRPGGLHESGTYTRDREQQLLQDRTGFPVTLLQTGNTKFFSPEERLFRNQYKFNSLLERFGLP